MFKIIDENCFYSKNLYNAANYVIRQEFINNNNWIRYNQLDHMLHHTDEYKQLMSQPSQQTLSVLDKNWKSFFTAIKDWKKSPHKYLGRPKLPKYLNKDGRFVWFIKNNCCRIENGRVKFTVKRLRGFNPITSAKGRLIQVRFVPKGSHYVMEVVYEIEVPNVSEAESKNIASIDLGINNFVTLTNSIGKQPIIINGKGVKSINQYYNKQKARLQSDLMKRNRQHWSRRLDILTFKRNNRVKNFTHNTSKAIVKWCHENNIDTLVCGYNKNWKQECSMSKQTNQKFVFLPYDMFLKQLEYKCQNYGIKFIQTEESYTSGTSFLDDELPVKESYDKSRRVQRGLFRSNEGKFINSDVNGSLQIMKKVFPNASDGYGVEATDLSPTVINVMKFVA